MHRVFSEKRTDFKQLAVWRKRAVKTFLTVAFTLSVLTGCGKKNENIAVPETASEDTVIEDQPAVETTEPIEAEEENAQNEEIMGCLKVLTDDGYVLMKDPDAKILKKALEAAGYEKKNEDDDGFLYGKSGIFVHLTEFSTDKVAEVVFDGTKDLFAGEQPNVGNIYHGAYIDNVLRLVISFGGETADGEKITTSQHFEDDFLYGNKILNVYTNTQDNALLMESDMKSILAVINAGTEENMENKGE